MSRQLRINILASALALPMTVALLFLAAPGF